MTEETKKTEELSLVINGKRISGWDSVRVTRGIERLRAIKNPERDGRQLAGCLRETVGAEYTDPDKHPCPRGNG